MKVRRPAVTRSIARAFAIEALTLIAFVICGAVAAGAASDAGVSSGDRPEEQQIVIKRGETYLIKGADPAREPETRSVTNPHALIVDKQPDGSVLVLGADPGIESVIVATPDGRVETYSFTVKAIADPANPLAPGIDPAAASESLDDGAGPVAHGAVPNPPATAASVISTQGAPLRYATNPPAIEPDGGEADLRRSLLPLDTISIRFGTSRLFRFERRISRVSIADTTVADLEVIDPHQMMLLGRKPGFTTLAVWDSQGHYEDCQVRVAQSGREQVMLNVTVAEIDRSKIENQGVDISAALAHYGVSLVGLPGDVATPYSSSTALSGSGSTGGILPLGGAAIPLLLSTNLTYALAAQNSNVQTQTFFRFLEENSLARILAEPQLVANSGEEAKFLSGGEIPIVIAQALNTSVVFHQFGTSVIFIPTVIGRHDLELVVKPEVSKPDFSQGVSLFGFTVPAFITQRAETVVKMKENQTLIIAGLILRDREAQVQKVPYLGDLPFVGGLFRSTTYSDEKTELVMSVTPRLVSPVPAYAEVEYPERGDMTPEELRTARLNHPDASRPRF
jgi:Flp pilus assembly secretin CpaC